MHHHETTGLIIDMRLNYGGGGTSNQGFSLLFNSLLNTVRFDVRCDPNNHFGMCQHPTFHPNMLRIDGNPTSYYDKPIAVLTGPGTVSAGDVESVRLSFHPMVKFFGKSSAGAFCTSDYPDLGHSDWFFYLSTGNAYIVSNHQYLAHTELDMFKEVWLTQQSAAIGTDNVVEAAIEWINNPTTADGKRDQIVSVYSLSNNYPNPFNAGTTISFELQMNSYITLEIYNLLGQKVQTIFDDKFYRQGDHSVKFDSRLLTSGVYLYKFSVINGSGEFIETRKLVLMK